ncbi:MAG: DNA translocase FtsK 4TM domain-containing protein, partial [Pseudomonadota bacterium]
MAYQTQGRDPLLDQTMQEALERRGRELIGILLALMGLIAAATILSYSPDDPNWMVATDAPVQNWLGRTGATVAAPLFMIVGWGALGLAALLVAWGARFTLDIGRERAFGRLVFAPIAIAVVSIYAATLSPPAGWSHSFGMGGLFGDTVLMMILQIVPGSAALGAKLVSFLAGLLVLSFAAFVLGFTWPELYRMSRWMLVGLVLLYAMAMKAIGRGAQFGAEKSRQAALHYQASRAARREHEAAEEELWAQHVEASIAPTREAVSEADAAERMRVAHVIRSQLSGGEEPVPATATAPAPETPPAEEKQGGLRAFFPPLTRREPEEAPEAEPSALDTADDTSPEDRVRSKIARAIRTRSKAPALIATPAPAAAAEAEPVAAPASFLRSEPVLTRSAPEPTPAVLPAAEPESLTPEMPMADEFRLPPLELSAPLDETLVDEDAFDEALIDDEPQPAPMPIPTPETKRVVQHPPKKPQRPSQRAMAEAQPALSFVEERPDYEHPPLSLLMSPDQVERHHLSDEALEENARMLENVLDDYGVKGEIVSVRPGPVVTMYELEPAPGLKASRVIGLADDIARSMSALSARVSTVPGRSVIGIELPNEKREMVALREILSGRDFGDTNMRLPLALGKDIGGDPIVANLAKMPHLLIAGTTGSGKSVAINTMILSLLYKLTPEECRLIMIDPKMLELSVYDGIPHLLAPVVTDPKKALVALKWVVGEMEERYRKMSKMGVRNIDGFNARVRDALAKG